MKCTLFVVFISSLVCLSSCWGGYNTRPQFDDQFDIEDIVRFDFSEGQCEGRQGATPILPTRVVPFHGNLFFSSALEHVVYRVDSRGRCFLHSNFSSLVSPASFSIGLQVDRRNGDLFVSNGGGEGASEGCETGCVVKIRRKTARVFGSIDVGGAPGVYSGIAINPNGFLHVCGEVTGTIVTLSLHTGDQLSVYSDVGTTVSSLQFWDSPPGSGLTNPEASVSNINVFGAPLGVNAITIHPHGHMIWTCNLDENTLSEHRVNRYGQISNSRVVADLSPYSCEGLSFAGDRLYSGSPFMKGDDVTDMRPGDSVFIISLRDYSFERIGGVTGATTGTALGEDFGPHYDGAIIVANSGFDWFPGWPCGNVANGGDFPCTPGPGQFDGSQNFAIQAVRRRSRYPHHRY